MSGIRSADTKPEKIIRSLLFRCGYRFRLHRKDLPGRPDIVLPRYRTVILVHGCFWHLHGCSLSSVPQTRSQWWEAKLKGNRERDLRNTEKLLNCGWRVLIIWECSFRAARNAERESAMNRIRTLIHQFLLSSEHFMEITGPAHQPDRLPVFFLAPNQ